ncbi:Bud site selection protein bud4 [Cryptotrichosporon argae]
MSATAGPSPSRPASINTTPARLRLHDNASAAARSSIISSSAKGWSPLQITKRDGLASPLSSPRKPSPSPASPEMAHDAGGPRRTSSSFRHMATNSLVARSPFKDPSTAQGAQAVGRVPEARQIIHERRATTTTPTRSLGEVPSPAKGAASTPRAAIGLGISAQRPRVASADRGSAVAGTRRVSSERKVAIPNSTERRVSATKENDSPDVRARRARSSGGGSGGGALKGLADGGLVSKSPFKQPRTPSGSGLADSSSRANESPDPSPRTVPRAHHEDDPQEVLATPSPRRVSGGKRRRVSPSANLARASHSPTPSPPRLLAYQPPSAGPSPLSRETSSVSQTPAPTPTPTKSSLSASRRLHGPRVARGAALDSPSRKTVTFQSVPDVKEFERMSVEGSADGSFEVDADDLDGEWEDDVRANDSDSLDDLVLAVSAPRLTIANPDPQDASSPSLTDGFPTPHESATADFVSTLIEEGLFSPPQLGTPAFADQEHFDMPLEPEFTDGDDQCNHATKSHDDDAPVLSTPSFGDSIHATPLFDASSLLATLEASAALDHATQREPVQPLDALPTISAGSPLDQPLPRADDHTMLFNADASQPSIYRDPFAPERQTAADEVHARQMGPLPDPFITLQTVTHVLSPNKGQRDEGGVPLGRTSHAERVAAARALATQNLGLGFPGMARSPAKKNLALSDSDDETDDEDEVDEGRGEPATQPTAVRNASGASSSYSDQDVFGAVIPTPRKASATRKVSDSPAEFGTTPRKVSEIPSLVGPSKRMTQFKNQRESRAAPPPATLDLPEPEAKIEEPEPVVNKRTSVLGMNVPFSLPFIGTSPLFASAATFEQPTSIPDSVRPTSPAKSSSIPDFSDAAPATISYQPTTMPSPNPAPSSASSDVDTDAERPLTPLPMLDEWPSKQSPHRIPSFDFDDLRLDGEGPNVTAPLRISPTKSAAATPVAKSLSSATPTRTEFGPVLSPTKRADGSTSESTTTRVRQRISRELIRETVAQRLAAEGARARGSSLGPDALLGTAPRPASLVMPRTASESAAPRPASTSALEISTARPTAPTTPMRPQPARTPGTDKALPPAPATPTPAPITPPSAPRMAKAHTADGARRPSDRGQRKRSMTLAAPPATPTGQRSASQAIAAMTRDGKLDSPKSALDKLIAFGERVRVRESPKQEGKAERTVKRISSRGELGEAKVVGILKKEAGESASVRVAGQDDDGKLLPPAQFKNDKSPEQKKRAPSGSAAPRRRRSMSVGDAEDGETAKKGRGPRLTLGMDDEEKSILESFKEEVDQIGQNRGYRVREKPAGRATFATPAAATHADKVSHSRASGDIDRGRAWRTLRRPSDMNEHAAALRRMRGRQASVGKSTGTVFVKVLGIENLTLPIPAEPTVFCITLDNGIDYIRTPYVPLAEGAKVNQEFALVEHPNFEFSLSLDIRRDPHILRAVQERANGGGHAPAPALAASTASARPLSVSGGAGGLRALFSSPRKNKLARADSRSATPTPAAAVAPARARPAESIATYLADARSGTVAKTHVAFKPVARQCDAKVLEIRYPMFAMFKGDAADVRYAKDGSASTPPANEHKPRKQVAKITLQMFRLPALPGVDAKDVPESIDECLRGIRHHAWHEQEYHEGLLTQEGGDCAVPRRRMFRLIGGNLVAINEVTKKEVATIDLRQATAVLDLNAAAGSQASPMSRATRRGSDDGMFGVRPRSFRLEFGDGDDAITFSADRDEDKDGWMDTLSGLIGRIPSNPLWAELLAERQRDRAARRSASGSSLDAPSAGAGAAPDPRADEPRAVSRAKDKA